MIRAAAVKNLGWVVMELVRSSVRDPPPLRANPLGG